MPYTIAVMRALVQEHGAAIDCIYWDDRKRTPFVPKDEDGITFHKRSSFTHDNLIEFMDVRQPKVVYVVGRMDKLYLKVARQMRNTTEARIVMGCDNQWTGDLKQRLAQLFSAFVYRRYFEFIWVAGKRQQKFAEKMSFRPNRILPHLLTADPEVFGRVYDKSKTLKQQRYPHNILFAGRFAPTKGIDLLVEAFTELKRETGNDWKLTLVGSGDVQVKATEGILVKSYMSGEELATESMHSGVLCLPSRYEPWGVVLHEFAMCGLPIICSDAVGASDDLVTDKVNGFIFASEDMASLKSALQQIMNKTDEELMAMSRASYEASKMNSPTIAATSLMSTLADTRSRI
jgi:glycosyltransferase involved in cell wall biosynthesis